LLHPFPQFNGAFKQLGSILGAWTIWRHHNDSLIGPPPACCQWGCLGLALGFSVSLVIVYLYPIKGDYYPQGVVCRWVCMGLCMTLSSLLLIQRYAALLRVRDKFPSLAWQSNVFPKSFSSCQASKLKLSLKDSGKSLHILKMKSDISAPS
jgi:hypothetical protein